jgi:methyl-accepting chemotaxis protein
MPKIKRRIKLIKPRLQIRLTLTFVGMAAMSLVLQFLLFLARFSEVAASLPEDGGLLLDKLESVLIGVVATSALLFLPLIFAVGILTTFKIAGPVYRFERHLEQIARGEEPGACRLREGDELQDLCEMLNRALATLEARRRAVELEAGTAARQATSRDDDEPDVRVVA